MYCDSCGTQLAAGQQFCGSCGKPVGIAAVPQVSQSRVARHLKLLAVFWFAASALNLIGAGAVFVVGHALVGQMVGQMSGLGRQVPNFLQPLMSAVATMIFIKALAGFAAGWGLLERQPWARILTLILAFISLLNIPFGTALGIYSIWVLMSPNADEEYNRLARAA